MPAQSTSIHVPQQASNIYPAANIPNVTAQGSILPVQVQPSASSSTSYFAPENYGSLLFISGLITGVIGLFFLPFFFISFVILLVGFFYFRKNHIASNRTNARRCLYALLVFILIRVIFIVISIVFLLLTGGGMIVTIISIITSVTK